MKIRTGDAEIDSELGRMKLLGREAATLTNEVVDELRQWCQTRKHADVYGRRGKDLLDRMEKRLVKERGRRPEPKPRPRGMPAASGKAGKKVTE